MRPFVRGCLKRTNPSISEHRKLCFSGLRHASGKCAVQHAMSVAWNRLLGRSQAGMPPFVEQEELCGREPFDEVHECMAARALP